MPTSAQCTSIPDGECEGVISKPNVGLGGWSDAVVEDTETIVK